MTKEQLVYYDSVLSQIGRKKIDAQYIDSHWNLLLSTFGVEINYGIYQSFNSANNLRLIENKKLLSDIISLYSSYLPNIQGNIRLTYEKRSDAFDKYIAVKIGFDNGGLTKLSTFIYQPEVIYLFRMGNDFIKATNSDFEININQIATVIQEIDKELKDRFDYIVSN
jgi:hypothetical protein